MYCPFRSNQCIHTAVQQECLYANIARVQNAHASSGRQNAVLASKRLSALFRVHPLHFLVLAAKCTPFFSWTSKPLCTWCAWAVDKERTTTPTSTVHLECPYYCYCFKKEVGVLAYMSHGHLTDMEEGREGMSLMGAGQCNGKEPLLQGEQLTSAHQHLASFYLPLSLLLLNPFFKHSCCIKFLG